MTDPAAEHLAARIAAQEAARARVAQDLDDTSPDDDSAHLKAAAIAACDICDDEGYTGSRRVCDHQDHTQAAERGHALVQAELDKIRRRKTDRARGVPS